MTDRSKSPRKRRLQLNAEEFAPPSDMYGASEEPRPDETWVRFYGGESRGVKRLSDLDDEAPAGADAADAVQLPPTDESTPAPGVIAALPPAETTAASAAHAEGPGAGTRPRPTLAPVPPTKGARAAAPAEELGGRVSQAPPPLAAAQTHESKEAKPPRPRPEEAAAPGESDASPANFEEWSRRWSPWLKRGGSIKVCEAFFGLTHARGTAECFTSNSEIMKLAELSRAQCIRNIHYLIEMGFLDELDEVNNREAKGTYYRFNLIPTSLVTPQG